PAHSVVGDDHPKYLPQPGHGHLGPGRVRAASDIIATLLIKKPPINSNNEKRRLIPKANLIFFADA
ncbi:hypothetical protein, partial [Streptomyces rimosus]|uniref:hypothetical protein n=1 Tax=Streptomyces rimosus TaxID=1927 RepID=UPI00345264B4